MKRPDSPDLGSESTGVTLPTSRLLAKLTIINELLASSAWEGGEKRGQRRLTVQCEGGSVRVSLQVESPALRVSAVGRSIDDALASLEALLNSPDVPWEQDRYPLGARFQGRKKVS